MMRIFAIIKRIANQFKRDKRTLAIMFLAPLLLITLLHYVFATNDNVIHIGAVNLPVEMTKELKKHDIDVKPYKKNVSIYDCIEKDDLAGFITNKNGKIKVTLENSNPNQSKQILLQMKQAATIKNEQTRQQNYSVTEKMQQKEGAMKITTDYIYGSKNSIFFDMISPIFIGFFIFFFVFLIAGISFLRERLSGTLERLLASPIKRYELEIGYMIGFGIFALLQSIIVAYYSIHILGLTQNGSMWYVLLITLMLAIVSLSLGMLLSTFASNEFQIIQFVPIVIVPQILLSGIFPVDGNKWLDWLTHIMPMYYGAEALTKIMIKGQGFQDFQVDLYILIAFTFIFTVLNIFALKKYRKV